MKSAINHIIATFFNKNVFLATLLILEVLSLIFIIDRGYYYFHDGMTGFGQALIGAFYGIAFTLTGAYAFSQYKKSIEHTERTYANVLKEIDLKYDYLNDAIQRQRYEIMKRLHETDKNQDSLLKYLSNLDDESMRLLDRKLIEVLEAADEFKQRTDVERKSEK